MQPELVIATCLWDANDNTQSFSRCYTEQWVERLFRGFKRHCSVPFDFVCYTDKIRDYEEPILQEMLTESPDYGAFMEPYRNDGPMILVGLDTIVTGNVDHLAEYCLEGGKLALPRDPFFPNTVCNGVALVPGGSSWVYGQWREDRDQFKGYSKDMDFMRSLALDVAVIDDLWPGDVVSYKGHVKDYGLGDAKIVYFHGEEKAHQLDHEWIEREWR